MPDANLMEIFCILDEFCKYLEPELKKRTIELLVALDVTVLQGCQTARSC